MLPNALAGVYVERGWNDFSGYASKDETTCVETQHSSQKVETEEHENEILDVEMKTNATQNGESVFGSLEKDGFLNERFENYSSREVFRFPFICYTVYVMLVSIIIVLLFVNSNSSCKEMFIVGIVSKQTGAASVGN